MKHRRIGALALATGIVISLAACSSGGDADGEQQLLIWDTGLVGKTLESGEPDVDASFIHQVAADFEADHPGVSIEIVQQAGDISTNGAQFQAASIAGNGPDIRVQFAGGPTLSFEDFFEDLTGAFPEETMEAMSGWNTVRSGYDPEGAIVGMPYGSGVYLTVFSNNEKLEAAGMDPAEHPDSWEDLMSKGEEFTAATGEPAFWAANLEGYVGAWVISALISGELGESASSDLYNGDVRLDDPAILKAYETWAELGSSGLVNPDAGEVSNADSAAGFIGGTGAYYMVGSWEDATMLDAFGDSVDTFLIPVHEDAAHRSIATGGPQIAFSVTNYSDHKELAIEFLNYLAQPEVQDQYVALYQVEASNHVDGDPAVIENRLLQEQAVLLQGVDEVAFPFDSFMPQSVIDLFYRLNSSTFLGTTSPEDAVAQLQAANEAELSNR